MLKLGRKSTEWWGVVSVGAFILLRSAGVIDPDTSMENIPEALQTQAVPYLTAKLTALADKHADLLVYAGVIWAYLKRRSGLKGKELNK